MAKYASRPVVVAPTRRSASARVARVVAKVARYAIISVGGVVMIFPLYWLFVTALRPLEEVYLFPPVLFPSAIQWSNIPNAWTTQDAHFDLFLLNSLAITLLTMVGNIGSSTVVAFGFARLHSRFREPLFVLILATLMVPFHVTLIPTYVLFTFLGWTNTFLPLVVPAYFGQAFYIFLLRQFIMTIPFELDDAAKIDGCTPLGIFFRIIVPLCKPAIAAVAIFSFQNAWNDFLAPLIYLSSPKLFTMALGIRLFVQQYTTNYQGMMVVSALMILPMIVVFFFAQKYFIQGITLTGIKG